MDVAVMSGITKTKLDGHSYAGIWRHYGSIYRDFQNDDIFSFTLLDASFVTKTWNQKGYESYFLKIE